MTKSQKLKGFTFIELLVIVGILIVLTAIAFPTLRFFQKESDLNNAAEEIINNLRLAQNKTLASEKASQYGIYFDNLITPHQYTLFKGGDYASRNASFDEVHKLPKTVEIYEVNLAGGGSEVVFDRVSGKSSQTGNLSLRLIANPAKTKTVCIAKYIISFCGLVPPGGLITDTRHVHSDLGWSIQNATFLKFDFINAGQVETIDMADYFNADKTKFDWGGEFIVGGIKQKYRVHTHFLDAFNTLLCIHRDGKNTEAVTIYIVDAGIDKEIVHYRTDGTGFVGLYGGTFEIQ